MALERLLIYLDYFLKDKIHQNYQLIFKLTIFIKNLKLCFTFILS